MKRSSLLLLSTGPKRRVSVMLAGSVLFHVAVVAGAYLWPYQSATPPGGIVTNLYDHFEDEGASNDLPLSSPSTPEPEPVPVARLDPPILPDEPAPVTEDPLMLDPATPAPPIARRLPVPRPQVRAANFSSLHSAATGASSSRTGGPATAGTGQPVPAARWNVAAKPAYPYSLRAARIQGSGVVRITTDTTGHVLGATIVQSSGNSQLDENICRHARSVWSGPAGASMNVPFTFQLP